MNLTNYAPRAAMRHGFSEWDEWHEALPGGRFLARANYTGPDAPEWMPAGSSYAGRNPDGTVYQQQNTIMRPGWWG
jgi:hypothetical protein